MKTGAGNRRRRWVIFIAILVVVVIALVVIFSLRLSDNNSRQSGCREYEIINGECIITDDKPIIYLYPEQETKISVKLGHPEKLITVYPEYNNGWKVLAQPNGDLIDLNTGRSQYALYWEGTDYPARVHDTGFVIKGSDTAKFLEEKLAILGLSEREANEFIIYWLPQLEHNPYNYIYFATSAEIEDYMPLAVTPLPDTTIRAMMEFQPLDEQREVNEQILTPAERHGFTVVEWGGSEILY